MSGVRRVAKGPGRRPLAAQRQRFMELLERGVSISAAARMVGVSRSAATNWTRGYKVYRRGEVVGFVPPLERLAVRQVSDRYLSQEERLVIADRHRAGWSNKQIAVELGRSPATISRELRRNAVGGDYQPFRAQRLAVERRGRDHPRRLVANPALGDLVADKLAQRWSPTQISRWLRETFPDRPAMWLCHESIYQAIYQPNSRWQRPTPLAPLRLSPLRTGRTRRRAQVRPDRRRLRFQQPMLSVHQRPFAPDDRSQIGHWEGDLIIGRGVGSAIGTLVERQTRALVLLHLPARHGAALREAIVERLGALPAEWVRSITWDQGTEMARHHEITERLGIPVYFCDAHSPWQRGSNENTNGLLRDYFPKGTDLSIYPPGHLRAVEDELNHRPRAILQGLSPADLFTPLLAS